MYRNIREGRGMKKREMKEGGNQRKGSNDVTPLYSMRGKCTTSGPAILNPTGLSLTLWSSGIWPNRPFRISKGTTCFFTLFYWLPK